MRSLFPRRMGLPVIALIAMLLSLESSSSRAFASTTVAPTSAMKVAASPERGAARKLVDKVKDDGKNFVNGVKEMFENGGKCREIRAKQGRYRNELKAQWQTEDQQLTRRDLRRRLAKVNGGISYEEYAFLARGKEDRQKLFILLLIAQKNMSFLPYAWMSFPQLLPSPFTRRLDPSARETPVEQKSRERAHAVVQTLMDLEVQAKLTPAFARLNIFGRKKQARTMTMIENLGKSVGRMLGTTTSNHRSNAEMVLNELEPMLYKQNMTKAERRLVGVPPAMLTGLSSSISGPNPMSGFLPSVVTRRRVAAHAEKIATEDKFLVDEKVDINTIPSDLLAEACKTRLLGGPGQSDEEMRRGLTGWLDLTVVKPGHRTSKTGEQFNGNLARATVMGCNLIESTRDARSSSMLPRLLFQDNSARDGNKVRTSK